MTVSDVHGTITAASSDARVSSAGTVAAEWVKFRTLRSTLAVLGAAMVGMVLIGLIVAFNTRHLSANLQPDDIVPSSTLQGYYLAQLLIGALGVLFVSGEYGTGMIRSSFAAVPKRIPVLWAKAAVFVAITFPAMLVACFVSFLAAQAVISTSRPGFSLSDPGVLRVVFGTAGYLTLIGLLGAMLGWIVRSTPGALVAYFATVLVLPVIFGNVLGTWGKDVAQFLPSSAGGSFASSLPESPTLSPGVGLIVLLAWLVVAVALAVAQLVKRDA